MNASSPRTGLSLTTIAAILWLALTVAGCQTTSRSQWDSKVGTYTFDQAVLELGPPDKSAELSDGARVAAWLLQRGAPTATYLPGPPMRGTYYGYCGSWHYMPPGPDWFLQLVFSRDGILQSWQKVTR